MAETLLVVRFDPLRDAQEVTGEISRSYFSMETPESFLTIYDPEIISNAMLAVPIDKPEGKTKDTLERPAAEAILQFSVGDTTFGTYLLRGRYVNGSENPNPLYRFVIASFERAFNPGAERRLNIDIDFESSAQPRA